jgi:hypothetical protein
MQKEKTNPYFLFLLANPVFFKISYILLILNPFLIPFILSSQFLFGRFGNQGFPARSGGFGRTVRLANPYGDLFFFLFFLFPRYVPPTSVLV